MAYSAESDISSPSCTHRVTDSGESDNHAPCNPPCMTDSPESDNRVMQIRACLTNSGESDILGGLGRAHRLTIFRTHNEKCRQGTKPAGTNRSHADFGNQSISELIWMMWSRCGPVPIAEIRQPLSSSKRFTYAWQVAGSSSKLWQVEISSVQPGMVS